MSWAFATPCSSIRIASRPRTIPSRLVAKPGESPTTTGVLPSDEANVRAVSTVASLVIAPRTISRSRMAGTGLKKCSPTTRAGSRTAVAISPIGSDDVFVARIALLRAAELNSANRARFSSSRSGIASMTRSASRAASPGSSRVTSCAKARARCSGDALPRSIALSNAASTFRTPRSAAPGSESVSAT